MSNPNKSLGTALENRVVTRARAHGLTANKQPGSGVFSDFPNDAMVADLLVECKVRSRHPAMSEMLEWLDGVRANAKKHDFADGILVYNVKGSRTPVVLCDLDVFLRVLGQIGEKA